MLIGVRSHAPLYVLTNKHLARFWGIGQDVYAALLRCLARIGRAQSLSNKSREEGARALEAKSSSIWGQSFRLSVATNCIVDEVDLEDSL